jgi:outer membrane protein OmpA-like peptidoglycan-associated protein
VTEQISPLADRVSTVEAQAGRAEANANEALARLDHLRFERRFVLDMKEGANFSLNSDSLTTGAQKQIDGFLNDLQTTDDSVFLVVGHTDSAGSEQQNYLLGQRRAASVARYLVAQKGIEPIRVTVLSQGESAPVASNDTPRGRQENRRVEIMVYKETIGSSSERTVEQSNAHLSGKRMSSADVEER